MFDNRLLGIKFFYTKSKGKCLISCPVFSASGDYPLVGSMECASCGKMSDIGNDSQGDFIICPELNKALFGLSSFFTSDELSLETVEGILSEAGFDSVGSKKKAKLLDVVRLTVSGGLAARSGKLDAFSKDLDKRDKDLRFMEGALELRKTGFSAFTFSLKGLLISLQRILNETNSLITDVIKYMDNSFVPKKGSVSVKPNPKQKDKEV